MKTILFHILLLLLTAFSASAQNQAVDREYTRHVYRDSTANEMPYRLLSPQNADNGRLYPLVVFLHGSGESGTDNVRQLEHGAAMFADKTTMDAYPAFVLFPQCPGEFWTDVIAPEQFKPGAPTPPVSKTETLLMGLIADLADRLPVDTSRIYIMGMSMGAIAAYDLVCRFPETFAAAVPICGAVNPDRLPQARDVKFMIFHGAKDREVPIICGRGAYDMLSSTGASVEYIEFRDAGHDCWDQAFKYPQLLPWLFSQSRHSTATAALESPTTPTTTIHTP